MTAAAAARRAAAYLLAGGMAFLAGATDVYGLARLGDVFVSFMSGNTTVLGRALGRDDLARAAVAGGIVALFVAGVVAGTLLAARVKRRPATAVLAAVTALLGLASLWPPAAAPCWIVAMGALNAAMTRIGSTGVSLTYVTGTLVRFGQGVAGRLLGRPDRSWLPQGAMWLSLLGGAVAAAVAQARLGADATWPLPALAALLTLASLARRGD